MTTKNQHVVPRGYLKNFENSNGKVWAYNIKANKIFEQSIENICSHKYTYETPDKIDNVLEKTLSIYESSFLPHINEIIKKDKEGTLTRNFINNEICFKYMVLQKLRSDSDRILFMRYIFGFKPTNYHMEIKEIEQNKNFKNLFNMNFKNNQNLEKFLNDSYKRYKPIVRIGNSKHIKFLTSDNPVITFYIPNDLYIEAIKWVLPISPNLCLYFMLDKDGKYQSKQNTFPYEVKYNTAYGYNQSIINVANYWIISQNEFDFITTSQINKRLIKIVGD